MTCKTDLRDTVKLSKFSDVIMSCRTFSFFALPVSCFAQVEQEFKNAESGQRHRRPRIIEKDDEKMKLKKNTRSKRKKSESPFLQAKNFKELRYRFFGKSFEGNSYYSNFQLFYAVLK